MEDILGIHNIDTGIGNAGVGWVVIPDGVDREQYINDCYRTQTLTINAGVGYGFFSNVFTDQDVMQQIMFPNIGDNRGSAVIWVRDDVSNLPIIVASLRRQDDYYILGDNQYRISKETENTSVEVFIDGNTSTLHVNTIGSNSQPARVNIKLSSNNKDSVFNISSDNEINIFSENKVFVATNNEIDIQIKDNGDIKTELKYKKGTGLSYKDEFGNEFTFKDGEIDVIGDKINHNGGKEPMVLGDTLANILNDLCNAIEAITVTTTTGPSSPPINVADFLSIQAKISNIKSSKSNLD